tara:strand:+ start:280 stop:423 length:144 start_codon:yes stop_codon:yes gene_type:complete
MTKQSNNERDPLLDELEERILEGNVIFTPDEEFLKRVAEKRKKKSDM